MTGIGLTTSAAAVALAAAAAAPAQAITVTEPVVFGDSNVDVGRAADPVPNDGRFPAPNTAGGRSSDGLILPEFVASRVGIGQINFAFGGATRGETNIVGALGNEDLLATGTLSQITEYETTLGVRRADPDALHLVWAGLNDLFLADKNDRAAVDAAVAGASANLEEAVTRLTGLWAGTLVLATRTPRPVLSDAPTPSAEPVEAARDDAAGRQLNEAIRTLAGDLDDTLASDVPLFDYEIIHDLIDGSGTNGFAAYAPDESQFCVNSADCGTLINFDAAHKTSAVHSVLADRFIERFDLEAAVAPVPLPATAWLPLGGLGGLAGFRRLRRSA